VKASDVVGLPFSQRLTTALGDNNPNRIPRTIGGATTSEVMLKVSATSGNRRNPRTLALSNDPLEPATKATRRDVAAVIFALMFPSLLTWVYFIGLAESAAGLQLAAKSVGIVIQIGFPLYWVVCVQKQRLSRPQFKWRGLLVGGLLGVAIVAAMFTAYHLWLRPSGAFDAAAEEIREKVKGFGIDSTAKFAALGVFYAAVHSLLEEYYWRWFVFAQLRRVMEVGPAIAISAVGFMAHHVIVLSVFFGWGSFLSLFLSLNVAVGGILWAWLFDRSRSLYGPWLSHAVVDAGIFLVGYEIVKSAW
jgi:membrane protease YdiL (CAAX protease family)